MQYKCEEKHMLTAATVQRNADCDMTDMCRSKKRETTWEVSFVHMFRLTCRSQDSTTFWVVCNVQKTGRGGGKHYTPFSLLAPFTRSHWRFPQWCWSPFLQEKKLSKQEVVTNLKSFLACFFVGCFSLFTWARSTFQNNIINGNVTPYWRTPDRFKHNLGQKDK